MGLRGPAPEPTALKILKGNPGHRALNTLEPIPGTRRPKCPAHLDDTAKAEWRRLVKILSSMRVVSEADYIALGNLCQAYSIMIDAQKKMNQTGFLIRTRSGWFQQSPLLGIVNTQVQIINRLCQEFGLTPSSRVRLHASQEEKRENKWSGVGRRLG